MPLFFFYVKGKQIIALNSSASDFSAEHHHLEACGFVKQFEEVKAATKEKALARFVDIKKEDGTSLEYFTVATLFCAIIFVAIYIIGFFKYSP